MILFGFHSEELLQIEFINFIKIAKWSLAFGHFRDRRVICPLF